MLRPFLVELTKLSRSAKLVTLIIGLVCASLAFAAKDSKTPSIWSDQYTGPAWLTDLDKARALAITSGKPLLLFFSGSDWCPPCKKADRKIFSQPAFHEFAQENYVLVNVDFPENTELPRQLSERNEDLVDEYKVPGFPYVVLLDPAKPDRSERFGACGFLGLICSEKRLINKAGEFRKAGQGLAL